MQSCFEIDLGLIKLSNISFLCLNARVCLVTIMKWCISGEGYKHLIRFSRFLLQLVLCKRLTLSAASIFVTEGLFIYIYFLLFEKIIKVGFPELEKNFSNDFALFS